MSWLNDMEPLWMCALISYACFWVGRLVGRREGRRGRMWYDPR